MVSKKRGKIVRRSVKSRRRTVSRPAGAFGMYRSTKFSTLRAVARVIKPGRTLTPFPDAKLVKHIYADTITLPAGAAAGVRTVYQFRCNSAYDPDYTSTGHQPLYYDEMSNMYKHYQVVKARIVITIAQTSTVPEVISLFMDTDTDTPGTIAGQMEQHRDQFLLPSNRNNPMRFTGWWDGPAASKLSKSAFLGNESYKGLSGGIGSGSNPSIVHYWHLIRWPAKVSTPLDTLGAVTAKVQITQYVAWTGVKEHVIS